MRDQVILEEALLPNNVEFIYFFLSLTTGKDEIREILNHEESIKSTKEAGKCVCSDKINTLPD